MTVVRLLVKFEFQSVFEQKANSWRVLREPLVHVEVLLYVFN